MKPETFEDYLQSVFMEEQPGLLDDDLPDAFDAWVSNLDVDVLIPYGDAYARRFASQVLKEMQTAKEAA